MTYDWNRLAHRIRERRAELGLTQAEIARRAGVTVMTVRNLETGRAFTRLPSSLPAMDAALDWEQGGSRTVLDGGEPTLRRETADRPSGEPVANDASPQPATPLPPAIQLMLETGDIIDYDLIALQDDAGPSVLMAFVHPSASATEESRDELRKRLSEFRRIAERVRKEAPDLSTPDTQPDAHN